MLIKKAASIPLVLHDPYFSIWSSADHLYDKDTVHWTGRRQQMRGYLTVDGKCYCFMGNNEFLEPLPQQSVDVKATATEYTFENEEVRLVCRFTSPLLPDNMTLVSRPCTYVDFWVDKKRASEVTLDFQVSADLVRLKKDEVVGFAGKYDKKGNSYSYASIGRALQQPLGSSDDLVSIDWGYAYIASADENAEVIYDAGNEKIAAKLSFSEKCGQRGLILAYDDILSINYMGQWRKAYWTKEYATILEAIGAAFADKADTLGKAAQLDADLEKKAQEVGGDDYVFLCNMSLRHVFAAHKLITDEEGEVIFLSKENASNGCIGTVDVSYPSVPLFFMYNTEYVKGMLRPIFKFAACDVWECDYAPHDVGRYPYAWGQVYGVKKKHHRKTMSLSPCAIYPAFYMYPAGSDVYDFRYQMPVEECGNMLVMTAEVCRRDGNAEFARPYWETLKMWKEYLIQYGPDPGEQLCTDDFAGHLAHNANLSVKAIMGVEAYAMLAKQLGYMDEAEKNHTIAQEMAANWEKRAYADDHYVLAFGRPETWSLKYNLAWDKIWGCCLFSQEVYDKELAYYVQKTNAYGTPLDSRSTYTKSDWILWCASMADDKKQAAKLITPVANYLENSESRVPFSDWYYTETGIHCDCFIARSVQGGIYMPLLKSMEK